MSSRTDRLLKKLWDHPLAEDLDEYEHVCLRNKLKVEVDETYYFMPEEARLKHIRGEPVVRHELWKGIVVGIRNLPSKIHDEPLIQVRWFWSKRDIEGRFADKNLAVPDCMRRGLDSMGDMEICPSKYVDVNPISCLTGAADIVELHVVDPRAGSESADLIENQTHVVEYFYRAGFDEDYLTLKGYSTLGCGLPRCTNGWNPDEQEQRYCYTCQRWFHTECLAVEEGKTQADLVQEVMKAEDLSAMPTVLLDMACQPAARGGDRHFTAGNIRLVTKARALLRSEKAREEFTGSEEWSNKRWKVALMKHFHMKKSYEGKVDREQLVLYDQVIYECALCCTSI